MRRRDRGGAAEAREPAAAAAGGAARRAGLRSRHAPGSRAGTDLSAAEISVRLQARARRDEVVGERAGAVVIRVSAPPVDGRANAALCRLIAKAARVAPSSVTVIRGHTGRDKRVRVEGVDEPVLRAALGLRV